MQVTINEIIDALRYSVTGNELADRIEKYGIATKCPEPLIRTPQMNDEVYR
jgi:hypothetical protein